MRRVPSFNEAAGIHRRKEGNELAPILMANHASMRPPEFTGGKQFAGESLQLAVEFASMRPPEFTGGKDSRFGR